ncbi:hypothetical protein [Cellulomonas sp. URHE0023]|nr:hypothetical protein [Cellulomonas sp. URHE0023]
MTHPEGHDGQSHEVPELEFDESVPPRPEEEIADAARSVPDPAGHGG